MTTREEIIDTADMFIRDRGYNAFSFNDISKTIGIKSASIHYHFPTKSDLGVSVIKEHIRKFDILKNELAGKSPKKKLEGFFSIYSQIKSEDKVCLVGSLATDFNTIDENVKEQLILFSDQILDWVTEILKEGKGMHVFNFQMPARTKAIMIISNMLAIVQLSRLTKDEDFKIVKAAIAKELIQKVK